MEATMLLRSFFGLSVAFLLTYYLVPIFSAIAYRLNILDLPDGKIKVHKKATPYLGGVAIYFGFIATLALVLPFENKIVALLLGSTVLLFVGLIDDLIVVKPYQKLAGQCLASLCFLKAGLHLKENFFLNNYWNIPVSLLWILSIINAFNLVDVMDGLATTLAIFATIGFIGVSIILNQLAPLIILGAFLGALLAFFCYNKPTAQIYLGDTGSLFIGGFLATIPFLFNWGTYTAYGYFAPIIILLIPLLEVGTLVMVRTYKGIPFYNGSPDHFCLYLKNKGWRVREILIYVTLGSLYLMLISWGYILDKVSLKALLVLSFLFIVVWYMILTHKRKASCQKA